MGGGTPPQAFDKLGRIELHEYRRIRGTVAGLKASLRIQYIDTHTHTHRHTGRHTHNFYRPVHATVLFDKF